MHRRAFVTFSAFTLGAVVAPALLAQPKKKGKFVVAFAQDAVPQAWCAAQLRGLQQGLAGYGDIELRHVDVSGDATRQIFELENFAAAGADVLLVNPRDADLLREPIARLHRQGKPVILLSRRVPGEEFAHYITGDNRGIARQAARFLGERLRGKGRVLLLQYLPGSSSGRLRTEGFYEGLRQFPGVQVVATKRADSQRALAIMAVEEALAENIVFDAIYAHSDTMALGAVAALKKAGRDPRKTPIVGIDYCAEARVAIRQGDMAASFTYPTLARECVEAILALRDGKSLHLKERLVGAQRVTQANVETIEAVF